MTSYSQSDDLQQEHHLTDFKLNSEKGESCLIKTISYSSFRLKQQTDVETKKSEKRDDFMFSLRRYAKIIWKDLTINPCIVIKL